MLHKKLMLGALSLIMLSCSDEMNEPEPTNNYQNVLTRNPEQAFPNESGDLITINSKSSQPIHLEYIDDQYIWSGDIHLSKKQLATLEHMDFSKRAGVDNLAKRWPNGKVYYSIADNFPNPDRILEAISHWETTIPALEFIQRTNEDDYIMFVVGRGCSSSLGMVGGRQFLYVASDCTIGNVIHEIGHSIGLIHEIQRTDRDSSVVIEWDNVDAAESHHFDTYDTVGIDGFEFGPFDFNSVMMNGSYDYSSNRLPTITKIDGSTFTANRTALSDGDIETVSKMYGAPKIDGNATICDTRNTSYTLITFVPTTPVWSVSSNLQIIASSDTSITVSAINPNSSEAAWIQTDMNGLVTTKPIWIGTPRLPNDLTHDAVFTCMGGTITATVEGAETYEWTISSGNISSPASANRTTYTGDSNTIYVDGIDNPNGFTITVKASNTCGETSVFSKFIPTDCNDGANGSVQL